jgi:hypothetical protein
MVKSFKNMYVATNIEKIEMYPRGYFIDYTLYIFTEGGSYD